ncbi:hypothetical protein GXW82_01445 [Streptacidiphilus sp. 4-A2]|nr:hypothetical protein [Streptacidiphilus sp. 4-A2]
MPVEVTAKAGKGRLRVPRTSALLLEQPAQAALAYVRAHAARLLPEVDGAWFAANDIEAVQAYGSVPVGATVTDGSAAAVALVAALVSYLGGHLVRTDVAIVGGLAPDGNCCPSTASRRRSTRPSTATRPCWWLPQATRPRCGRFRSAAGRASSSSSPGRWTRRCTPPWPSTR